MPELFKLFSLPASSGETSVGVKSLNSLSRFAETFPVLLYTPFSPKGVNCSNCSVGPSTGSKTEVTPMTNQTPANYCQTRSKITLDIQQFRSMHHADRAKAGWSGRRFQQAKRQLGLHDALCPACSEAMHS